MRGFLILLSLLLAAPAATAQVILPNTSAVNEGAFNNSYPFRFTQGGGHYQAGYDATQFGGPITISEISFRYKGDTSQPSAKADFKMTLSYSLNPWNALNTTFANNIDPKSATVTFDGIWTVQAFSGDPALPNPFTERIVLTTPFTYDPSKGDLLMDLQMRQSTYPSSAGAFARCDGTSDVGVSRLFANTGNPTEPTGSFGTIGLITEFTAGTPTGITPYGVGCAGTGGFIPELSMTGTPAAGQQVTLALDKGLGGSLSLLLISLGQASVPLGGGCTLLVQSTPLSLIIPLGGAFGVGGVGSYSLPALIPPATPPATVYLQGFVSDPAAPILLSVTNGLQIDIQ